MSNSSCALVMGVTASGKTTMLRQMATQLAQRGTASRHEPFQPAVMSMRKLMMPTWARMSVPRGDSGSGRLLHL